MSTVGGHALERALSLPESTWAFLDWATAVVRINLSIEEFEARSTLSEESRLALEETLTHEHFHLVQICNSGYLYYFAASYLKLLFPIVHPCLTAFLQSADEGRRILGHDDVWQAFTENIADLPPDLYDLLNRIDTKSGDGISIRDIVESSAFLAQKQVHVKGLTIDRFLELEPPGEEYNHAFKAATEVLGGSTFDLFHLVAHLSLCFGRPEEVFLELCHSLRTRGAQDVLQAPHATAERIAQRARKGGRYLGSTSDFLASNGTYAGHPFYLGTLAALAHSGISSDPLMFTLHPVRALSRFRQEAAIPVLFNPDDFCYLRPKIARRKRQPSQVLDLTHILSCTFSLLALKTLHLGYSYIELRGSGASVLAQGSTSMADELTVADKRQVG